ncbi:MAG: hypothetical protein C4520_18980 [Candidatus Abyssobacteria bacterium SURF_5]|uniref:Glycosyltransferase RgtA/B/C/D-like domain-containing protein n=1 Tax=Abyssobacteria bacterium (strain SURF_5) TaxID=2093360 RepID=A0A3A4NLP2_ABYX5|nr:MAG: hypothetical protein C4520_18980 [Candidatus Abyssubacteria bacterium SURF_5]
MRIHSRGVAGRTGFHPVINKVKQKFLMEKYKKLLVILLFAILAAASIAGYKYNIPFLADGICLADTGQTYLSAVYLLEGRVPYEDFFYQWGPYALYLNGYVFKILGIKISSVRLLMTLVFILTAALTYLLGREFLPRTHSFAAALIVHLTYIRNALTPYANLFVIPVGLLALLLLCRYYRNGKRALVFSAGLLCGLALGLKLNAGLFATAGLTLGLLVADGRNRPFQRRRLIGFDPLDLRPILVFFLIAQVFILLRSHLTIQYLLLFVAPILVTAYLALRTQGYQVQPSHEPAHQKRKFERNLLLFATGAFLTSLPWIGFYLYKFDGRRIAYHLLGSALEHSKHIFLAYPEPNSTTIALIVCAAISILLFSLAKRIFPKYLWAVGLVVILIHALVLRHYMHASLRSYLLLVQDTENIVAFIAPIAVAILSTFLLVGLRKKDRSLAEVNDPKILILVLYHVFFFLVAYPHTEYTHISWSYPTTMIFLLFLLEKARVFLISSWPALTRPTLGIMTGALLLLPYPALIINAKAFWLFQSYCELSLTSRQWVKRSFIYLASERADVYEYTPSAYQIETVNRFLQTYTSKNEYVFEFPTTFFYYYSQRTNPSSIDYFYPGLFSDKQDEVIRDLEQKKPRYAIIFDDPKGYLFTFSDPDIQITFKEIIGYLEKYYRVEKQIGYFTILKRI